MKAKVVAIDERESGLRMILNYGHTLGHAIEAATEFRALLHGEAIAWGILAALQIALARKTVAPDQAERVEQTILAYGPLPPFPATRSKLLAAAGRDKKIAPEPGASSFPKASATPSSSKTSLTRNSTPRSTGR